MVTEMKSFLIKGLLLASHQLDIFPSLNNMTNEHSDKVVFVMVS